MSTFKVKVKWSKSVYSVDLNTSEPALKFKEKIYDLTKVPVADQKILVKGGKLKDDHDWATLKVKDGQQFMMMGRAEDAKTFVAEKTVFLEDLPADQRDVSYLPAGLENLGNTCYLNSVVQTLKAAPELSDALTSHNFQGSQHGADSQLVRQLSDTLKTLRDGNTSFSPGGLVLTLREVFPQFAEMRNGQPAQQDAEECFQNLIMSAKNELSSATENPVTRLLGGKLRKVLKNTEVDESQEPGSSMTEEFTGRLMLPIKADSKYFSECLTSALNDRMSKHSETVGRDCDYEVKSAFERLPFYLAPSLTRFRWKQKVGGEGNKAKVLRPIEIPMTLDMYDFCTEDLKDKLKVNRDIMGEIEEVRLGVISLQKSKKAKTSDNSTAASSSATSASDPASKKQKELSDIEIPESPAYENDTGLYELQAVISHMGRSAEGGHYVAWVKGENKDEWYKFDDDVVSVCREEEIKKLSGHGGGDWHIGYILLYKSRQLKDIVQEAKAAEKK